MDRPLILLLGVVNSPRWVRVLDEENLRAAERLLCSG
jgi:hypothetical protein